MFVIPRWSFAMTVAAAAAIILGLGAGTARADSSDNQYIALLQRDGVPFTDVGVARQVALKMCDAIESGYSVDRLTRLGMESGLTSAQAHSEVVDAVAVYCPQYSSQIS
jgi:Protein of unknown function (DUF732)